jgi:hypothetical protein
MIRFCRLTVSENRMIPTPREIFSSFERGELEREEMHALMALHARELIREMEEDHLNPAAAWIEGLRARRAASQWVRRHGSRLVREVLAALADVPDFPPARLLWNASHPDVPIHCFLRFKREPVFKILRMELSKDGIHLMVEYGGSARGEAVRQRFLVQRNASWKLQACAV